MLATHLCKRLIDFDAQDGYEIDYVHQLLNQLGSESTVVLLRNAHLFTAQAFAALYDHIQRQTSNTVFVLISSDESKIFPPLLDYVKVAA